MQAARGAGAETTGVDCRARCSAWARGMCSWDMCRCVYITQHWTLPVQGLAAVLLTLFGKCTVQLSQA